MKFLLALTFFPIMLFAQSTRPMRPKDAPAPPPFMLGVNLCGAEFGEKNLPGEYGKHYIYPSAKSLDYYKSRGLMLVRLPFRWERMQPALNGELDANELKRLSDFVAAVRERGMKVIPEPHNFARWHGKLIGTADVPNTAFADFWKRLATHFKGEEAIYAMALVNEPHDTGGKWPAAAQAATDAIRAADPARWIIVPGDGWSGAADWRRNNERLWINDPAHRVIYEAHLYFDADKSGRYAKSYEADKGTPAIGIDRLRPFRDWLAERNAIGFVGEFGVPAEDERWLVALSNFTQHLRETQMSGCYWAGGPWWNNYPLSIEPRGGADRPQMKALSP